jgi:hypothetical protein
VREDRLRISDAIAYGTAIALAACTLPGNEEGAGAGDERARYRIADGDTLGSIAAWLELPGGWRALAAANHLRGDAIRAGATLEVPVEYLRDQGIDPYVDLGLEPLARPLAPEPLVPCADEEAHGACATVGDTSLCVEPISGGPLADPEADADCLDLADMAFGCEAVPVRQLVAYRGGVGRVIAELPERGPLEVDAHRIDLDGDGRPEIVTTIPIEVQNHHGWEARRAVIIDDQGSFAASFDVSQWGEGSLVEAPDGACDVLATSWEWLVHPREGEGMYFVGRRLAWARGALAPRARIAVRRFRTYFHRPWDDVTPTPAAWLSIDTTWWPELGDGTPVHERARGTIVGVARSGGAIAFDVEIDGRRVRFDPSATMFDDSRPADVEPLGATRLGADGTALPEMFVPADPARWVGRSVIVLASGGPPSVDASGVLPTLWIDPPAAP